MDQQQTQEMMPYPDEFLRELGSMTVVFARLELVLGWFLESCPEHTECQGAGRRPFLTKIDTLKKYHRELSLLAEELEEVNDIRCDLIHGVVVGFSDADERFKFLNKGTGKKKVDRRRTAGTWEVQNVRIRARMLTFQLLAVASDRAIERSSEKRSRS